MLEAYFGVPAIRHSHLESTDNRQIAISKVDSV